MTIFIDTDSFPANARLYADEAKAKPLPRIIPAVQLTEGRLQIGFLGDYTPYDGSTLSLAASIQGTQTQVLASNGSPVDGANVPTWEFDFALNSAELAEAIETRGNATLSFGVIASATGYRQEWQFLALCTATATGELDPEQVESAKDYAEQARQSAQSAEQSRQAAGTSASNAATSATNAASSASNAASSASNASASASNAATSATNAANSASAANTSATNAGNSANAAAGSAGQAAQSAEQATETLENVYTKPEIDGVDTGAEVTLKMNEIIAQLKEYEETTGDTLPLEFWEALMAEFQRWQESPTESVTWLNTADAQTSPFLTEAPTKPVVNFSVTQARGSSAKGVCFLAKGGDNFIAYLPRATHINACGCAQAKHVVFIAPKATIGEMSFRYQSQLEAVCGDFSSVSNGNQMFIDCSSLRQIRASFDSITNGTRMFSGNTQLNQPFSLPKLTNGSRMFESSALSAENISATLDTLQTVSSGTITFTGCPGASELTQDSPSVAAAVAKGWTVQL